MYMKRNIYLVFLIMLLMQACGSKKMSDTTTQGTSSLPYFQCVGKVIGITNQDIGRGGAADKFKARVIEVEVSSSTISDVKNGDTVYCELIAKPNVDPVEGREYVFKSKSIHPAYAKGVYMLETNVLDLTR